MNQKVVKYPIRDIVEHIKLKANINTEMLAKRLECNRTYLSRVTSEGAPEPFYRKLTTVFREELKDYVPMANESMGMYKAKPSKPDHYDQAALKALINDYLKLKAVIVKRPLEELIAEFEADTTLILRDLGE